MKNFIFIAITCLCYISATYAGNKNRLSENDFRLLKLGMRIYESNVKSVEYGNSRLSNRILKTEDLTNKLSGNVFLSNKFLNEQELKKMVETIYKEQLDSIITTQNSTGEKLARQYFIFDENRWPLKRINSYWNTAANSWDEVEVYEYDCDEDGYVISQRAYSKSGNTGQRYDYEYNDQKWGTSLTLYGYSNGDWIPVQKGEYEYDDRANITQETLSAYDTNTSGWLPVIRNKAEYDTKNRRVNFEPYQWDGTDWVGSSDSEKKEYEWDINGNSTLVSSFIWENGSWFKYCMREQDFKNNDPMLCTRQEKRFFNKILNNWAGAGEINGVVYRNTKAVMEYDELGRMTYECAYTGHTADGYTKGADGVYEWKPTSDGGMQCVRTSTIFPLDKEAFVNNIATTEYDAKGNEVYFFERHIDMLLGELINYDEQKSTYDNNRNLLEFKRYSFGKEDNSKKLAVQRQLYIYDDQGNIIEFTTQRGQGAGEEDWVNYTHFTYAFDQNSSLIEEKAYKWNGNAFIPNWGNENEYDYSIALSEINMWPGANTNHKILETRSYEGKGNDWDYQSSIYYYSEISPSNIAGQTVGTGIQVYPRCAEEQLNVVAEGDVEINIYNVQGLLMLTTAEKQINVSGLSRGIYIVEVNGYKTKIVKK